METSIQDIVQQANYQVRAAKADDIRQKNGQNTIVLFELGNYYEGYNESAEALHDILQFPITSMGKISITYFKKTCDYWVFPRLIREGYKICIYQKGQF